MTPETKITVTWDGYRAPFAKAFVTAQKALESVKKAATNPAFKSKYADLSHVVEATVPGLNANGIGVIQFPGFDGELVHITTTFLHDSGSSVTGVLSLKPSKLDPQGVGSAITYGRRYSLLCMTGAAPEDDDGQAASGPVKRDPTPVKAAPPASLDDRVDAVTTRLLQAPDRIALEKVWELASALCADLSTADPEKLAALTKLYDDRRAEFIGGTPFDNEQKAA